MAWAGKGGTQILAVGWFVDGTRTLYVEVKSVSGDLRGLVIAHMISSNVEKENRFQMYL